LAQKRARATGVVPILSVISGARHFSLHVMSKKTNIKRCNGPNLRTIANRKYKQKIYALCRRVQKGDKIAEEKLNRELETNSLAQWAVKHWIKVQNSRAKKMGIGPNKDGLPTSRAKGRKQPKH
jgi:hypothetical protein